MTAEKTSLRDGLGRLREEGLLEEGGHPDFPSLLALQAGEVRGPRAEALAHHLETCPICREILADWARFPDLEPPAGGPSPAEDRVEEDWQKLRGRLREEGLLKSEPKPQARQEIRHRGVPWIQTILPWAMAASLAVGLGLREVRWQREAATLAAKLEAARQSRPEKNFSIVKWQEVIHGVPRGAAATSVVALEVPVPANVNRDLYASYEIEVHDAQGRLIRRVTDLTRDPALTLFIDRNFLDLEKYRFTLYGVRRVSGEREEIPLPDQ